MVPEHLVSTLILYQEEIKQILTLNIIQGFGESSNANILVLLRVPLSLPQTRWWLKLEAGVLKYIGTKLLIKEPVLSGHTTDDTWRTALQ